MRNKTSPNLLRHVAWSVLLVLAFLLQTTSGFALKVGSAHFQLVIPVIICIAMFERESVGCWYGLAGGLLMDVVSPVIPGYNALMLLITGTVAGLLIHHLLRNTVLTALVFCFVSLFLYESNYWLFFVYLKGTLEPGGIYWSNYFLTVLWSMVIVIPLYLLVRVVKKKLTAPQQYETGLR